VKAFFSICAVVGIVVLATTFAPELMWLRTVLGF